MPLGYTKRRRGSWIAALILLTTNLSYTVRQVPELRDRYEDPSIQQQHSKEELVTEAVEQQQEAIQPVQPLDEPKRNVSVITWEGNKRMTQLLSTYLKGGNLFCEMIDSLLIEDPLCLVRFQIVVSCQELFSKNHGGTGNYLGLLYGMRLAAEVYGNVELNFTCPDAEETRNHLVLPWLTGVFPARSSFTASAFPKVTRSEACRGAHHQPLGHLVPWMQRDFRHMAVALVGRSVQNESGNVDVPPPSFVPQLSQSSSPPPYAHVELDEAVLHFRCGDLIDSRHPSFAFMNFRGYTRHIAPHTKSIGILTQPFANDTAYQRPVDATFHTRDRCRIVVHSLVEYIQQRFPQARVRIHNSEPIALTYARMILAQQAISGISTFGVMPTAATFGTGYIRIPDHPAEVNQWVLRPRIDQIVGGNIVLIKDPKMPVRGIKVLWRQQGAPGVLAWFWNDTWGLPNK